MIYVTDCVCNNADNCREEDPEDSIPHGHITSLVCHRQICFMLICSQSVTLRMAIAILRISVMVVQPICEISLNKYASVKNFILQYAT